MHEMLTRDSSLRGRFEPLPNGGQFGERGWMYKELQTHLRTERGTGPGTCHRLRLAGWRGSKGGARLTPGTCTKASYLRLATLPKDTLFTCR